MKYWTLLVCTLCLVSCVHTAVAPVCTPEGVPAVVRIPNARHGDKVNPAVVNAMNDKIDKGLVPPGMPSAEPAKPVGGSTQVAIMWFASDFTTKKGERMMGYVPMVAIRSSLPADQVDRAAGVIAAAWYRSADKRYDVYPISNFVKQPQKKP